MLTFKQLSEKKKTPCKINPKIEDIKEKSCDSEGKKKCSKCKGEGCKHCGGTGYHSEAEMSEAKKKDDTYLETDFKKRQKNNEKARKDLMKGPQMKNPHFESTEDAYVSQEEVSEESTEEVAETETLLTFGQFCEDSRRMSNKQHTKRVKQNIKAFGSDYTPPDNYDPDANRGQGEVVTRKQMEKKRRKSLPQKEEVELEEGRAEDAQASLAKIKSRQKVLDAHEKKTGKKLDIAKTPEHKAHKQNFPGAKRQEKKVKGAKETPSETQNRRIMKSNQRIVKKGYTSKEKKEVQSMAKHASRFD